MKPRVCAQGATPDGKRLALYQEGVVYFLSRQMETKFYLRVPDNDIAVAQDFVIASTARRLDRFAFNGDVLATYEHTEDDSLTRRGAS